MEMEGRQTMACMVGMSQGFIFIKPKEELNKRRVGVGPACLQITLSAR